VNGPANNPGIAPQLALALSEGPLGGVRAPATNTPGVESSPSSGNASAFLVVFATPVLVPQASNSGGDSTPDDVATALAADLSGTAGEGQIGSLLLQRAAYALPESDLLWILNQPFAITKALLHSGGETLEGFDRWLADRPMPQGTEPVPSQASVENGPASADSDPDARGAEYPAVATSWTDQLFSRPFWWGATSLLCLVWGALNGHKWLLARRERRQEMPAVVHEGSATGP
jgi:hypothetical protein